MLIRVYETQSNHLQILVLVCLLEMSLPGGYIGPVCLGNKLQQTNSIHLLIRSGSPPIAEGVAIPHHLLLFIKIAVSCVCVRSGEVLLKEAHSILLGDTV